MLYDVLGRKIKTLLTKEQSPGYYSLQWDGKIQTGKRIPSGIYFLTLSADNRFTIRKIIHVN